MSDLVRISQLSALSSVDLASNYFVVLDENDTTQSAEGSTKKVAGSTISDAIWALSSLYITASDSSTTTTVNVNSANWQNTFTNFSTQSANNISVRTTVNSNSANWQSVYSTVNANSATTWVGGGGVSYLPLSGGTMDAGAEIVFASDSLLRQSPSGTISVAAAFDDLSGFYGQYNIPVIQNGINGTINISAEGVITIVNPGNGYTAGTAIIGGGSRITISVINGYGLDTVCANNYIHRWENGTLYITDPFPSQRIRVAQYKLTTPPNEYQDETVGYRIGSRFILDDGTTYVATSVTANNAVWEFVGGGAILNPGVTYIQTNGNDTTAQLGNPAKPYLTVAAALSAVSAASQTRPTLVLGRGTFVGDALLTSSALSIFMTGAGLGATTVNATWNGEDGVIGAAGDPPGSGGDGESFMGCPLLSSDKSLTLNIAITGGNGNIGGENTGSGSGGTGGNGGSIAGVTLRGVSGSLSMIPGPLGTGGNGEEGSGGDGLDGTVGQSSLQFCYLTTAGVDFIGASFSIINNAAVIEV